METNFGPAPKKIDKNAIDELFKLSFFEEGDANAVLLGPTGVGKMMLLKNLAHHCVMRGYTVRFTTASAMLNELAAQESSVALGRRLKQYALPQLLCIDEVGYLSYDNRYADLLFEVDRLIHRCEVIPIEGQSYRAKEAKERAQTKQRSPNETRSHLRRFMCPLTTPPANDTLAATIRVTAQKSVLDQRPDMSALGTVMKL